VLRQLGTEAQKCFIVEDKFYCSIVLGHAGTVDKKKNKCRLTHSSAGILAMQCCKHTRVQQPLLTSTSLL
jgi:hypothetical protein